MQTEQTYEFICDKAFTADNNFFQLIYFVLDASQRESERDRERARATVGVEDERKIPNNVNESHWMENVEPKTVRGEQRIRRLTPRASTAHNFIGVSSAEAARIKFIHIAKQQHPICLIYVCISRIYTV